MTTAHQDHHSDSEHHSHDHHDEHDAHEQEPPHDHRHGDWTDEAFVAGWLEREQNRERERQHHFAVIRALVPKKPDQEFRYLNLGAGPGNLDAVLLKHFTAAHATLVDVSLPLLAEARNRLSAFEDRIEYVHADLEHPEWTGAVSGPFDFVFTALTAHHTGDTQRIRALYREVYRLLGHGGMFFNLEYVRPTHPSLVPLARWAEQDTEAGLSGRGPGGELPGTLQEHLGWMNEAGFPTVEVFWKEMNLTLMGGIRDHLHLPEGHAEAQGESHAHGHEAHGHEEHGHAH